MASVRSSIRPFVRHVLRALDFAFGPCTHINHLYHIVHGHKCDVQVYDLDPNSQGHQRKWPPKTPPVGPLKFHLFLPLLHHYKGQVDETWWVYRSNVAEQDGERWSISDILECNICLQMSTFVTCNFTSFHLLHHYIGQVDETWWVYGSNVAEQDGELWSIFDILVCNSCLQMFTFITCNSTSF